jgi:putative ABC transport system ATP-binding protein
MIRVDNVTKIYRTGSTEVKALRGVSLDKSTSGEILINGEPVSMKKARELAYFRRDNLGFVFQTFNLIPVLKAHENVSFALSLLRVPDEELRHRTFAILEEVGLKGMEDRFPKELSGGQQQRVAIARALVKKPQIVLADEPTANLDSSTGEEILQLMKDLNERHGTTFIFSTHDQMVMDYARRLIQLHDGMITDDQRRSG